MKKKRRLFVTLTWNKPLRFEGDVTATVLIGVTVTTAPERTWMLYIVILWVVFGFGWRDVE